MRPFSTASKAWVAWLTALAVGVSVVVGAPRDISAEAWIALALLGGCGAVAHLFPVRSARGGATYTLTNIFLIAGAACLPLSLLTPLAIIALTPERWARRGRPGMFIGWSFNVAQSALALHVAGSWLHWLGVAEPGSAKQVVGLAIAAALFTIVQDVLVGVVISLQKGTPFFRAATFSLPALLSDSLLAVLGVMVAGLWLFAPALLALVPPLLIIVFRMTRTAHLAHLAELDAKTGAHNYGHFERALDEELIRSRRIGRPLAVLFADLDQSNTSTTGTATPWATVSWFRRPI
jgi:hypothetical protein